MEKQSVSRLVYQLINQKLQTVFTFAGSYFPYSYHNIRYLWQTNQDFVLEAGVQVFDKNFKNYSTQAKNF